MNPACIDAQSIVTAIERGQPEAVIPVIVSLLGVAWAAYRQLKKNNNPPKDE